MVWLLYMNMMVLSIFYGDNRPCICILHIISRYANQD